MTEFMALARGDTAPIAVKNPLFSTTTEWSSPVVINSGHTQQGFE
jgi:hypothetical protein